MGGIGDWGLGAEREGEGLKGRGGTENMQRHRTFRDETWGERERLKINHRPTRHGLGNGWRKSMDQVLKDSLQESKRG